jgi:hypothetical protein
MGVNVLSENNLNQLVTFHVCNELAEIEKTANLTNIFDVLKITSAEIRHSNMLAWLLNPQNPHGFGDSILKEIGLNALLDDSFHGCFNTPCINEKKKKNRTPCIYSCDCSCGYPDGSCYVRFVLFEAVGTGEGEEQRPCRLGKDGG